MTLCERPDVLLVLDAIAPFMPGRGSPAPDAKIAWVGADPVLSRYKTMEYRADLWIPASTAATLRAIHAEAEKILDMLVKDRPYDPDIWYQVAETRGLSKNITGLHQARAEYFALVGDFDQAIQQLDLAKRRASNNFQLASRIDARQRELMEEKRIIEQMLR